MVLRFSSFNLKVAKPFYLFHTSCSPSSTDHCWYMNKRKINRVQNKETGGKKERMLNHGKQQPTQAEPSVLVPTQQKVTATWINPEYF